MTYLARTSIRLWPLGSEESLLYCRIGGLPTVSKRNLSEGRDCDQALEIGPFPPSVVGVSPGSAISLYMTFGLRDPETQIRKAITILLLIRVGHF